MTITQALLGFAAVAAMLTLIPGLDTTLVLRSAVTAGRRQAFATALGISTGALIWGAAAALGAAALLAASHLAYQALTVAGAIYLCWMGVAMVVRTCPTVVARLRGAGAARPSRGHSTHEVAASSALRSFATGVWTNLLNPKIGVFYIATIPQFIPPGSSPLAMGLLLAGVHDLIAMVWFALIIGVAHRARRWLAHERAVRIIDRVAGAVLITFGLKLVLSRH